MGLILDPEELSSWKPVFSELEFKHKRLMAGKLEKQVRKELFDLAIQKTPSRNWDKIKYSTDTDKQAAERGLFTIYDLIGFPKPEVRWIPSPLEGFRMMENERSEMNFPYFQQYIRNYLAHKTKILQHGVSMQENLNNAILESVAEERYHQHGKYKHYFKDCEYKGPNFGFSVLGCGIFDSSVCRNYDEIFYKEGLFESMQPFCELSANCGFWFASPDLALISSKPIELCFNGSKLHNDNGPAIRFADGFGVHFINDFAVPKKVALGLFDANDVLKEENVEIRRIMTEKLGGSGALLKKLKLPVAHKDEFGILYRVEGGEGADKLRELYGKLGAFREDFCVVQVLNSTPEPDGSKREFLLRVPPTCRTAKDAVLWTGGITRSDNLEVIAET